MKITIFDIQGWEKRSMEKMLEKHKLTFCEEQLNADNINLANNADVISVFVTSRVTSDYINKLPKLKMIATRSTGFDNVDTATCEKRGVEVLNVPSYGENTVAEHSMALLLAITRRLVPAIERTEVSDFSRDSLMGVDVKGKVVGVIGTGHIGRCFIRMVNGFGAKVIAYDAYPNPKSAEELGFTYVPFEYLLGKSDVISMHVPYSKKTHHIINADAISKMKKSVIFINTARGPLVDTFALYEALKEGKFFGVGLDVCEDEKLLENPELALTSNKVNKEEMQRLLVTKAIIGFDRVIVTPHNAFNSKEAVMRILQTTADNINAYSKGIIQNSVIKK